jgi:hypothetical protein
MASDAEFEPSARFPRHITTLLVGIAVQRGEAPDEVAALLSSEP